MVKKRDMQRERLYKAEWTCFTGAPNLAIEDIQNFIREIYESKWFKTRGFKVIPKTLPSVQLYVRGHHAFANPCHNKIMIPRSMCYKWLVLHEFAHLLTDNSEAWHGRAFARAYLQLVERWLSREDMLRLREHFKTRKVHWRPKKISSLMDAVAASKPPKGQMSETVDTFYRKWSGMIRNEIMHSARWGYCNIDYYRNANEELKRLKAQIL